jgi:pimeloyl-ACP methyl ester carboxylesterase
MQFVVPVPHARLDLAMADGAVVHVRRHGNLGGPRVVLSHGNGFAIDGYFPFWRQLLGAFEVVVYDQRNHGENPLHDAAGHSIETFVVDMERIRAGIEAAFGRKRTAGLFHSVSAITALFHAARRGPQWDALVLFDPPIVPGDGHPLQALARGFELYLADWSKARPSRFAHTSELAEQFRRARAPRRWIDGAADLMAQAITRPAPGGGYALACPPSYESAIYRENAFSTVWQALPRARARRNIFVVASDPAAADAKSPGKVCALLPSLFGIRHTAIADTGHLLQIERPEAVAHAAVTFLAEVGFVA